MVKKFASFNVVDEKIGAILLTASVFFKTKHILEKLIVSLIHSEYKIYNINKNTQQKNKAKLTNVSVT